MSPSLSAVRRVAGEPVGFVFAGRPPSLQGAVRTAGLGVLPAARRCGHARALLEWVATRAEALGSTSVRCLVEPPLEGLYRSLHFEVRARRLTLVWPGGGPHPLRHAVHELLHEAAAPRRLTEAALEDLCGWLPEAWTETPVDQRRAVPLSVLQWRAKLSKEPAGWLVQRLSVPPGHRQQRRALVAGLSALRDAVPGSDALFFYGVDEPIVQAHGLVDPDPRAVPGLAVAQRFAVMERFTTSGGT